MNKLNAKFITRVGILLALTVVFQSLGRFIPLGPNGNFIVGPLVNACLLIAAASVGIGAGAIIAVITPFTALLTGAAIPPLFIPFIAIGNFLIVLGFYLLMKKSKIAGVILGSVLKFGFLFASIRFFVNFAAVNPKKAVNLVAMFSIPQLITALMGGVIALIVIRALGKQLQLKD